MPGKKSLVVGTNVCREKDWLFLKKMMPFRGQASWAKMTPTGGQANSTGVPTNQMSKQS